MKPKHVLFLVPMLLIALFASACGATLGASGKANTLTAVKVDQVSLEHDADFWSKAPVLEVASEAIDLGGQAESAPGSAPVIRIQAAFDGTHLVLRTEWADASASLLKNAWSWDGNTFTKSGDEDRLMIHFPVNNDAEFASKGCASACHNDAADPDEWHMATASDSSPLDQWHWKSVRTNATGQSDDKWLGLYKDPTDVESGHNGDKKEGGGEAANVNEAGDGPAFMSGSDLTQPFIFSGDEVPVDTSMLTAGMVIPGYILSPMTGSRGDVSASGIWADGKWVVTIMRALDTGNSDDVTFIPPKSMPFGLAVVDNGGGYDHVVVPDVLILEWK